MIDLRVVGQISGAGVARRRRLIQKRLKASFRRLTVDCLLACPRAIIQSSKPMICKAMPPFAHNTRLNAYFLGDRTCAPAFGRQQHYLRPLQSLCGVLGARQRASSTLRIFGLSRTSLASGIIPILNHHSPTKKSGY